MKSSLVPGEGSWEELEALRSDWEAKYLCSEIPMVFVSPDSRQPRADY